MKYGNCFGNRTNNIKTECNCRCQREPNKKKHSVQNRVFELCLSHSIYNSLQCIYTLGEAIRGQSLQNRNQNIEFKPNRTMALGQNDFFSISNRLYEIVMTLSILHINVDTHINYKCQIHLLVVKIHFNMPQPNENTKPG